ncbi:hypothetical protein [Streptomyces griseoluteus]|uniref:hypothetical protein n=1 Tax=Streptomyces griseoluteus TaxID=29306 RepID=UPI0036FD8D46
MAVHRVAFLVFDGMKMLDVCGPAEVFEANTLGARYSLSRDQAVRAGVMLPPGADFGVMPTDGRPPAPAPAGCHSPGTRLPDRRRPLLWDGRHSA